MKLDGKRVLVTGGSSGIGLAIAKALLAKGAKVATSGRRSVLMSSALAELRGAGGETVGIVADVGTAEGRTETLRRARVPEDLVGLWLGHTRRTVTDLYAAGLQQDRTWRREWCDRVGLGFSLIRLHGLQNVVPIDSTEAA